MKRYGFADVALAVTSDTSITYTQSLEVSLDCEACRRRCRTVLFHKPVQLGTCTPTAHLFHGRLLSVEQSGAAAQYKFEYACSPFVDAKYPGQNTHYGPAKRGAPTWIRAYFDVVCPACGKLTQRSTQTNLGRPWTCVCSCGAALDEDRVPPALRWSEAHL